MSVRLVWPFVELGASVENRRALVERLQADLGLTAALFNDPDTRVSLQRALELLSEAVDRSGARRIGLHAAKHTTTDQLGAIEYVARSSRTLGEAFQSYAQYTRLLAEGVHLHIETRDPLTFVRVWFDGNLMLSPPVYEYALATLLNSARRITGDPQLAPFELHFSNLAPSDLSLHREIFKCNLRFNMPATQLVLNQQSLNTPLPKAEPSLNRLLQKYATSVLASLPRNEDIVTMVRDMLTADIDLSDASATRLARRLGMSVRTLARRLGEDGTSYRTLLDEARRQVALRDLAQTLRPIHHIAQQLGFANSQSFHRAFRRWTGDTAASYRDRSRRSEALQ